MSQILACKSSSGIVLAADATAVEFGLDGEIQYRGIQRLHHLSSSTAILTGGAVEGEDICRELKAFIAEEGLVSIDEIYPAAIPFLATAHERFMRKRCALLPVDPIHHLHFLLAGVSELDTVDPYRIYLVWTKRKLPQLDSDEVEAVYAVPRMVGLEHRLHRHWRESTPVDSWISSIRDAFKRQAGNSPEIGGPFAFGVLSGSGYKPLD